MPSYTLFENVLISSDGGEQVVELVATGEEIYDLYRAGKLEIGNVRPDHDIKVSARGKHSYAKTPTRLDEWADELNINRAIMGNLSWNMDPETTEWALDEKRGTLTLKRGKVTTPDSATRHRSIIKAMESTPRTFDPSTRFSIRCWFVPESSDDPTVLTYPEVFDSYNQRGKPVDATVAKWNFQRDVVQRMAQKFALDSPQLGVDNIETKSNTVSANSYKLVAYNTISKAIEDTWTTEMMTKAEEEAEAAWLVDFWTKLVEVLPDLGRVGLARRRQLRRTSLVGAAVMFHGYMALADRFRTEGHDLSLLETLDSKITLEQDGLTHAAGDVVDWFDYDNPEWQTIGVLVPAVTSMGESRLSLRNSHQSRRAATTALTAKVGLTPV